MNTDAKDRFDGALVAALSANGIALCDVQRSQLLRHYELVLDANRLFNLTRVTVPEDFAVTLHADSLAIVAWSRDRGHCPRRILDIGTGAGIPAVPVAVVRPDWRVVAVEGTGKKARFVESVAEELGLDNLEIHHSRSELWRDHSGVDAVAMKAIAPLDRCVALAAPHVRPGGHIVVYKGMSLSDVERANGLEAARKLGLDSPCQYEYCLVNRHETLRRALWVYRLSVSRD